MNLKSFFSLCFLLGHEEPIRVMSGKTYRFQCPRCLEDLGKPLKRQKFKARTAPKLFRAVTPKVTPIKKRA